MFGLYHLWGHLISTITLSAYRKQMSGSRYFLGVEMFPAEDKHVSPHSESEVVQLSHRFATSIRTRSI